MGGVFRAFQRAAAAPSPAPQVPPALQSLPTWTSVSLADAAAALLWFLYSHRLDEPDPIAITATELDRFVWEALPEIGPGPVAIGPRGSGDPTIDAARQVTCEALQLLELSGLIMRLAGDRVESVMLTRRGRAALRSGDIAGRLVRLP